MSVCLGNDMAKAAFPTTREQRIEIYLRIMEEIKERLNIIESLKAASISPLQAREICFLELRHICELIAIGCLAAQGTLKMSGLLGEEYNPVKIFKELERNIQAEIDTKPHPASTFPAFFPQDAVIERADNTTHIRCNTKTGVLTRKDAEKLWSISGNFLHRLSVKKFLTAQVPDSNFWIEIDSHISKIRTLLVDHLILVQSPQLSSHLISLYSPSGHAQASILDYGPPGSGTLEVSTFSFASGVPAPPQDGNNS